VVADFLEADGWEVLLLGPGAPAHDIAALVESEQPDLVALSTATAGVIDGVVEVFAAIGALSPRPCLVAGGRFWTPRTSATALEFGADLVLQDPRELVAAMHERIPPLEASP
jgi:methanogenic corrinoid protein MtbC1